MIGSNKRSTRWILAVLLAVGTGMNLSGSGAAVWAADSTQAKQVTSELARAEAISGAFRDVARKAQPAVVFVRVTGAPKASDEPDEKQTMDVDDLPEALREFFRNQPDMPQRFQFQKPQRPQLRRSSGSGVIIDAAKGLILTNNHVVSAEEGEDVRIDVTLADSQQLPAKVVGQDPKTDLALIQIKTDGVKLEDLPLGDSEAMEVGDWVLAIGAPFGQLFVQTVTQGIISAKGRNPRIISGYEDFIQTDAAINPGNSGGPLLNLKGEVIGINTAIVSRGFGAGFMGIGFAVPSETVKAMLPMLKEGKEVVRGYLGVGIKSMRDDFPAGIGKTFGLKEDRGVLVEEVLDDTTPAGKAGLKGDDIILEYDGKSVNDVRQLQTWVAWTKPGTTVNMKVWRDRKEISIPVTIERQPEEFFAMGPSREGEPSQGWGKKDDAPTEIEGLGMTVEPLTETLAKKFGWDNGKEVRENLLVVTKVDPLGEAGAVLGIGVGDLILEVQGKPVASSGDLEKLLSKEALAKGVRLRIKDARMKRSRTLYARVDQ